MSCSIFISYRRKDNPASIRYLTKCLLEKFKNKEVFKDTDSIEPGAKWGEEIKNALKEAKIVLVVVGNDWLCTDEASPDQLRICDENDWVRKEIEGGLDKRMIPILLDGIKVPKTVNLPKTIQSFFDNQVYEINFYESIVEEQIKKLIDFIESKLESIESGDDFKGTLKNALVSKYEILEDVVSGEKANIYKARDKGLERIVAIKAIKNKEYNDDFAETLKFAAKINACVPNSISILGAYVDTPPFHIIMPYFSGGTLRKKLKDEGAFQNDNARNILVNIGKGLINIHKNNLSHGNVKPSNIIFNKDDDEPYLNPFSSIQVITKETVIKKLSSISPSSGNSYYEELYYLPPELFSPFTKNSKKIDQYMLGLVGYELLTGKIPFTHTCESDLDRCDVDAFNDLKDFKKDIRGDCPDDFSDIIYKMTDKNPDNRFNTLHEAIDKMEKLSFNSIEIAKESYARCMEADKLRNSFFKTFYSRLVVVLPENEKEMLKSKGIGEKDSMDQYKILREAVFILLKFGEDDLRNKFGEDNNRRKEPNILSRIAEKHGRGDHSYKIEQDSYEFFRDTLIATVCGSPNDFTDAFDIRCQKKNERDIIKKAWQEALKPGIDYMKSKS